MRILSVALLLWLFTSAGVHGQVGELPSTPSNKYNNTAPVFDTAPSLPTSNTPVSPQTDASHLPSERITVSYLEKFPVGPVNGEKSPMPTRFEYRVMNAQLDLNSDLDKIELTGDGKRAAVQTITAARHKNLLQTLKDAKTEAEKVEAAKKLEANYRAHYAVETAWREERIAELEKRIEEMRSQVKERATSEDKYVEAAMTLAKLHAQGIAAEPPKLITPVARQSGLEVSGLNQPLLPIYPGDQGASNVRN